MLRAKRPRRDRVLTRLFAAATVALASAPTSAFTIRPIRNELTHHTVLTLNGLINQDDNVRFAEAVAREEATGFRVSRVNIGDIRGGEFWSGMRLAEGVAHLGVAVQVRRECSSACAPVALGALAHGKLQVTSGARMGLHRGWIFAERRDCDYCAAYLSAWASKNGVPLPFVDAATNVPNCSVDWFDAADLVRYGATVVY